MAGYFAGVDLGTTAVKAGLFTGSGELVAAERWPLTMVRSADGSATQDPREWTQAVTAWLAEQVPLTGWSVGGQMNTYALFDPEGTALTSGITWQDRRRPQALDPGISFTSAVGRAMLFKEIAPDAWSNSRWMLMPKDVLVLAVAGRAQGDVLSWNGVLDDGAQDSVSADTLRVFGDRLPALGLPTTSLDSQFGPLALGSPDTVAVVLGCGLDELAVYTISGTSESVVVHSDRKEPAAGVRSSIPLGSGWLHVAPSSVGGVTLDWAAAILTGGDVTRLIELGTSVTPDDQMPVFGPYLAGERAPLWDPSLTGTWSGLRASHSAADLAAAVLEGVSFSVRYAIECAEESAGHEARRVIGQGGILQHPDVAQLRANVLECPIEVVRAVDTGVRGAAAIAMASVAGSSLVESAAFFAASSQTYYPRPAGDVAARYRRWRELSLGLAGGGEGPRS